MMSEKEGESTQIQEISEIRDEPVETQDTHISDNFFLDQKKEEDGIDSAILQPFKSELYTLKTQVPSGSVSGDYTLTLDSTILDRNIFQQGQTYEMSSIKDIFNETQKLTLSDEEGSLGKNLFHDAWKKDFLNLFGDMDLKLSADFLESFVESDKLKLQMQDGDSMVDILFGGIEKLVLEKPANWKQQRDLMISMGKIVLEKDENKFIVDSLEKDEEIQQIREKEKRKEKLTKKEVIKLQVYGCLLCDPTISVDGILGQQTRDVLCVIGDDPEALKSERAKKWKEREEGAFQQAEVAKKYMSERNKYLDPEQKQSSHEQHTSKGSVGFSGEKTLQSSPSLEKFLHTGEKAIERGEILDEHMMEMLWEELGKSFDEKTLLYVKPYIDEQGNLRDGWEFSIRQLAEQRIAEKGKEEAEKGAEFNILQVKRVHGVLQSRLQGIEQNIQHADEHIKKKSLELAMDALREYLDVTTEDGENFAKNFSLEGGAKFEGGNIMEIKGNIKNPGGTGNTEISLFYDVKSGAVYSSDKMSLQDNTLNAKGKNEITWNQNKKFLFSLPSYDSFLEKGKSLFRDKEEKKLFLEGESFEKNLDHTLQKEIKRDPSLNDGFRSDSLVKHVEEQQFLSLFMETTNFRTEMLQNPESQKLLLALRETLSKANKYEIRSLKTNFVWLQKELQTVYGYREGGNLPEKKHDLDPNLLSLFSPGKFEQDKKTSKGDNSLLTFFSFFTYKDPGSHKDLVNISWISDYLSMTQNKRNVEDGPWIKNQNFTNFVKKREERSAEKKLETETERFRS